MHRSELKLDNFLPALIRNLAEEISVNLSRRYTGDFRLSITEWRVLLHLAEHSQLTASRIVEVTAMEKSKVSRALSRLEERGFVSREVAEEDHRSKLIRLTENGARLYRAIVPRVLDWEKEWLEALDVSEYRDLLFLLDKLSRRLKTMDGGL